MQYTLQFIGDKKLKEEDFILSYSNIDAYQHIKNYEYWPESRLILLGPEGSGKSHLAKIFIDEIDANLVDVNQEYEDLEASAWVIEDIENIVNETMLFHKINFAKEHSIKLLMTAETLPKYTLKDLQSRINASSKVIIKKPNDEILRALLFKHFAERQLKIHQEVIDYIFSRTERSFAYIERLVINIDKLSLEEKRNITVPLVKRVLEEYMPRNSIDET
jgi:chromosomal replication initiation ATPase DnaA